MKEVLKQLKIKAEVIDEKHTGNISRYYLKLLPGCSLDKLEKKATEIALALKSYSRPIIYPVLHQGIVILEVVVKPLPSVLFDEFDLTKYDAFKVPVILGKTLDGSDLVFDLITAPHVLVAGMTGAGKSVLLNSIICSILESGKNIKLSLIDPKCVELSAYKDAKQLLHPIAHSVDEARDIIEDLICEMNQRFKCMANDEVNNVSEYKNNKFPSLILMIDEFGDLVLSSKREFSDRLCLLAQKGRAAGISIVIATQRPTVGIINGNIKANFSTRICLRVSSMLDSRVVIDRNGAEKLLSKGEALIVSEQYDMVRFKGALIDKEAIEAIALKNSVSFNTKLYRYIRSWI